MVEGMVSLERIDRRGRRSRLTMYTLELTEAELRFADELVNAWINGEIPRIEANNNTALSYKICEQLKKSTVK